MDNQIEDKLNSFLNEMVAERPAQPFAWLARRLRREQAGSAPAVGTVPLMDPKLAGATVGAEVQKAWAYTVGLSGGEVVASSGGAGAKGTGINLSIEPLGKGVLLAIRQC